MKLFDHKYIRNLPLRYQTTATQRRVIPSIEQTKQFLQQQHVQQQHTSDSIQHNSIDTTALRDRYNRQHTYLRISLTERCNLRCTYCMPESGIQLTQNNHLLTTTEVCSLLHSFVHAGVNKLRLTGGEPLIRKDIVDIVAYANTLSQHNIQHSNPDIGLQTIGITTNGILLQRKLNHLITAGLTHVNISLDTLNRDKFFTIARRDGYNHVINAIYSAIDKLHTTTLKQIKLNVVVMRNINDNEILDFVKLTEKLPIEIRFIEYMPFDGNRWNNDKFVSYKTMLHTITQQLHDIVQLPLDNNHTSKIYQIPGYAGTVGFITSMSDHFCNTCNRLRITADGNIKVCLFDNNEISLRDALRNNIDINEVVRIAVQGKKAKHAGMFELAKNKNRPMITIGG